MNVPDDELITDVDPICAEYPEKICECAGHARGHGGDPDGECRCTIGQVRSRDVHNQGTCSLTSSHQGHPNIQIQSPLAKINKESVANDEKVDVVNGKSNSKIAKNVAKKNEEEEIFGDLEDLNFKHEIPTPSIFDYDFENHWNINSSYESKHVSDDGGSSSYYYL
ncbi:uncharacterized protein LOC111831229 [Capsella rubella]|uniref:uncharacterized protein LOC111831229 n=1 Tax=Capsella rubella TaxID=81985 RepID=UPI000CD5C344|nr:uncharacterized protein LOC111831229 [Capsella rubella]